ncbi:hypothetical protein GCM10011396_41660 [Undibacterium terreum]|uniref:Uncharacterized protein n=1 Tax=Undibacterium terreum TaxID=1224302 RepID=A0A916UWG2_9BURK|nr:hypothetical protein GCM10011396_41660 [Undibacterium terreum]
MSAIALAISNLPMGEGIHYGAKLSWQIGLVWRLASGGVFEYGRKQHVLETIQRLHIAVALGDQVCSLQ